MSGARSGRPGGGARAPRRVACPACGKPALFEATNPSRPFCSERCRLTDLGAWASESYRVPARPAEDEGGEGPKDDPEK